MLRKTGEMVEAPGRFRLGWGTKNLKWDILYMEKAMAPHSTTLAWKIPRTEEPGRLQSMGSRLPGYTHNIINLSQTENLVTVMWANEQFDPNHPDTFFEPV